MAPQIIAQLGETEGAGDEAWGMGPDGTARLIPCTPHFGPPYYRSCPDTLSAREVKLSRRLCQENYSLTWSRGITLVLFCRPATSLSRPSSRTTSLTAGGSPAFGPHTCHDDCIPMYIVPAPAGAVTRTLLCSAYCGRHAQKCVCLTNLSLYFLRSGLFEKQSSFYFQA